MNVRKQITSWLNAPAGPIFGWILFISTGLLFLILASREATPNPTGVGNEIDPQFCPATFPECLNRDVLADLAAAGAEPWELRAVERLQRHTDRGMTAYVRVSGREIAGSWAHFTICRGRLGLGDCPPDQTSLAHYWSAMELLYSDAAGAVTLAAWRRLVGPVVREAREHGWPVESLDLVAAASNSAPAEARRIGRQCHWNRACFVTTWATTPRRMERMR